MNIKPTETTTPNNFYNILQSTGYTEHKQSFITSCVRTTIPRQAYATAPSANPETSPLSNLQSTSLEERTITEPLTLEEFFNFLSEEFAYDTAKSYREQCRIHLQNILGKFENLNSPEAIATLKSITEKSKEIEKAQHTTKWNSGPVANFVRELLWHFRLTDLLKTYGNELINDPCSITKIVDFGCTLDDCLDFNVDKMGNPRWIELLKDYKRILGLQSESIYTEQNYKHETIYNLILKYTEDTLVYLRYDFILDSETKKTFQNQIFQLIEVVVRNNPINDTTSNKIEEKQLSKLRVDRANRLHPIAKKFLALSSDESWSNARKIGMLIEPLIIRNNYETEWEYKCNLRWAKDLQKHGLRD